MKIQCRRFVKDSASFPIPAIRSLLLPLFDISEAFRFEVTFSQITVVVQVVFNSKKYIKMRPTSIFVGGLGNDIEKEDLEREFRKFGTLNKVWVARNPPGFAFIEFEDDQDANEAIKEMNGATINGSEIRVDLSRGGGRGRGGRGGGRGRGGGGDYDSGYRRGGRGSFRGGRGGGDYERSYGGSGGGGDYNRSYGGGGDGYRSSGYRSRSPMGQR